MIKINQKLYTDIEIDTSEKDIVILWMNEKTESNCIQIERKNIDKLIKILQDETKRIQN